MASQQTICMQIKQRRDRLSWSVHPVELFMNTYNHLASRINMPDRFELVRWGPCLSPEERGRIFISRSRAYRSRLDRVTSKIEVHVGFDRIGFDCSNKPLAGQRWFRLDRLLPRDWIH